MLPFPLLAALVFPPLLSPAADEATWTQWRGPNRDAVAPGAPWPDALALELVWRAEDLGPSYSGPVVGPERVYTTETLDEEFELVRAFDRATGEELWVAEWPGAMEVAAIGERNGSWIRATPALDGDALYVAGIRDVLVRLDAATGEEVWRVDFPELTGVELPDFGCVCSPLVVGDLVVIQAGGATFGVDKASGDVRWESLADGGDALSAFASPQLGTVGGVEQLLVQTRTHLAGLDPVTGSVLWKHATEADYDTVITTPLVVGGDVLTGPYGKRLERVRATLGEDGTWSAETVWQSRAQAYMCTPVVVGEHAYLFQRSNRLACVDLEDGEVTWISEPTEDENWSLVARGEKLLGLAHDGMLHLLAADPAAHRVLDARRIADAETWAHLAVAGDLVAVRERDALAVHRWREIDVKKAEGGR